MIFHPHCCRSQTEVTDTEILTYRGLTVLRLNSEVTGTTHSCLKA